MKKLSRKSSKPIINWFQRKLAGTVRARRASDGDALRASRVSGVRPATLKEHRRRSSIPSVPPLPTSQPQKAKNNKSTNNPPRTPNSGLNIKRNTISLDGSDEFSSIHERQTVESSDYHSSLARESLWSPRSLSVREADEDASVRPLPPSVPPSPSPSHSSSSYLSDPRTFASMAASTKPTTVLSVDLNGGMAHIAQAPPTPIAPNHRSSTHTRSHSAAMSTGGSITFSALPTSTSRPPSAANSLAPNQASMAHYTPQHTSHHPRNNPRPSSPPLDNASMFTLASSAFGMPGARIGANAFTGRQSTADDSVSYFSGAPGIGDSTSHFPLGELDGDDERLLDVDRDGDIDASVRALRPRSSRRGSWESEASGWSAHFGAGGTGTPGTPSLVRERSLWTSGSMRTGTRSINLTEEELSPDKSISGRTDDISLNAHSQKDHEAASFAPSSANSGQDHLSLPTTIHSSTSSSSASTSHGDVNGSSTPKKDKGLETPKVSTLKLEDASPIPKVEVPHVQEELPRIQEDGDGVSPLSGTDAHTDVFLSVPSTPAAI